MARNPKPSRKKHKHFEAVMRRFMRRHKVGRSGHCPHCDMPDEDPSPATPTAMVREEQADG